jgi:hypothetical protein
MASAAPSSQATPVSAQSALYPAYSSIPIPAAASLPSILDRPIPRGTALVSLSAFSYLFSELVQYSQQRVDALHDLEKKLSAIGYVVGLRSLELLTYRASIQSFLLVAPPNGSGSGAVSTGISPAVTHAPISLANVHLLNGRKEKNLIAMLQLIHGPMWKALFGRAADGLEKSTDRDDEYYIYEREPLTNRFASAPREMTHFNCAAFIAGVANGLLDAAQFKADVTAHFNTTAAGVNRTVYVIKFEPSPRMTS